MKCIPKPGIAARTPALVYFIDVLVSITYEQDVPRYLLLFTSEVLGNKTVCIFLLFLWSYFPLLTLLSGLHRHSPVIWTDNMQEIPMPTSKHIWTKLSEFLVLNPNWSHHNSHQLSTTPPAIHASQTWHFSAVAVMLTWLPSPLCLAHPASAAYYIRRKKKTPKEKHHASHLTIKLPTSLF